MISGDVFDVLKAGRKRKKAIDKRSQAKMNKTMETLSKMMEEIEHGASKDDSMQPKARFGGTKAVKLSDFSLTTDDDDDDEDDKKDDDTTSNSIYSGAGMKLDAFDSFHNSLNRCIYDYKFNIADAAFILKQLTPSIISKIVPLLSQKNQEESPQKVSNKQAKERKSSRKPSLSDSLVGDFEVVDGEGAIDLEVSEINKDLKANTKRNFTKPKNNIKRPDASRPTRMLSPGSNSCSPVSAAVQALISISAPMAEGTNTVSNSTSKGFVKTKNSANPNQQIQQEINFLPKQMTREFSSNVFLPVHKPEVLTSNHNTACSTNEGPIEIPEVLTIKKNDNLPNVQTIFSSAPISFKHSSIPQSLRNMTSMTAEITTTNQRVGIPPNSKLDTTDTSLSSHNLTQDDSLPMFGLLLNTPGLSDINCGLPSPFAQVLPGSPMAAPIMQHNPLNHSPQQNQQRQQKQQLSQESPTIPLPLTNNTYITSISTPLASMSQTCAVSNFSMIPSTVNFDQSHLMDSSCSQNFVDDTNRIQNNLRAILPKTIECTSSTLLMSDLLSTSSASSNIQTPEINVSRKIDEKFNVSSIPPNQMFTKLNPLNIPVSTYNFSTVSGIMNRATSIMSASNFHLLAQQPLLQQQQLQQQQYKQPDLQLQEHHEASPRNLQTDTLNHSIIDNKKKRDDLQMVIQKSFLNQEQIDVTHQQILDNISVSVKPQKKHSDNGGGKLEVASALLSMGTENDSSSLQAPGSSMSITDTRTLEELIEKSLRGEESNVSLVFNDNGTFKLDDVQIDPKKHTLTKDSFTCGKCKRVFTSVMYLAKHIKRVCPDMSQRKWKCDKCAKAFRHPFGLQQHMLTHTGERPHKCNQCAKAFYSANDLRRHERTHSGEKPYQCLECGKFFSTTISLKTHSYIHTGERPHKCPHCPKAFATSSKLNRHAVTHLEKRPYACDQCSKTFNRSGDLRKHYTQHYGKTHELLDCNRCNKSFATQKALLKHQKTHSPQEEMLLLVG